MKAAILSVGNELLFGQTVDTNAAWLCRALSERGVAVVRRFTVRDVDSEIRQGLTAAIESADIVFVSGGLGPTPDDVTKAAVADLLDRPLVEDAGVRADLQDRFRTSGHDSVPALSRGQAEIPKGASVLRNPKGTAPGLLLTEGSVDIVLLPGVPRELRAIFEGDLQAVLKDRLARPGEGAAIHHRVLHTTGIPEPRLAELLEERLAQLPPETTQDVVLAYLPDLYGVDIRFTTSGGTAEEATDRIDRLVAGVDSLLSPWLFHASSGDLAEAVSEALRQRGAKLAVAESCTGGLVAKRITDLPGSSGVFLGGIVAYSNDAKVRHAGVSEADLERYGAVSEAVARQLAVGVATRFGAEVGVGVTGVAGPGGGTEEKPVGTVWIASAIDGESIAEQGRFAGDRDAVRERAAQAALAQLYRRLRK
jgi:nicotinamide-nucleotide amidase